MPHIHTHDLSQCLDLLPQLIEADLRAATDVDLIICVLGFEERCLAVSRGLAEAGGTARIAAMITYDTNQEDNDSNRLQLVQALKELTGNDDCIIPLEVDGEDFQAELEKALALALEGCARTRAHIVFDISGASSRAIMRTMSLLLNHTPDLPIELTVLYSEAATYHPTEAEWLAHREEWVSRGSIGLEIGVSDVVAGKEYPGRHTDRAPSCLLLFPNFSRIRTTAVVDYVDPALLTNPGSRLVWLLGVPHLDDDRWRLDAMKEINAVEAGSPEYNVSTFDYREVLSALEGAHQQRADEFRITLAPTGSKMQSLACALLCYVHRDINVVFSIPQKYNSTKYSEGVKAVWSLRFPDLNQVRSCLRSVGTLEILSD